MAIDHIKSTVDNSLIDFSKISSEEWSRKSRPEKWSKQEILGHLIDSASTNLRRFVMTQYLENQKIVYHQDEWVQLQDYQGADVNELIDLWSLLNNQIIRVLKAMPDSKLANTCDTGKEGIDKYTLEFLIDDYVVHMKHHLSQIIES